MQKTSNRFICAVILLCVAAIAASARAPQSSANDKQPHAYLPFTAFNFGDIYKGETISYIFVIKNEGNANLIINDFVAACGCEVTNADRIIPPGKEGYARIEVNTATQSGEILKLATLHTNDPERPNIVLTLVAKILTSPSGGPVEGVPIRAGKHVGPIFLGPDARGIVNVAAGQNGKTEFTITVEQNAMKVLRIESEGKYFAARLETIEAGKRYKIVAESLPTVAPGDYDEQLRVITDSPMLPSLSIPLHLIVQPNR